MYNDEIPPVPAEDVNPLIRLLDAADASPGALDREQADMWIAEQATRAKAGRLFLEIPLFLASAGRP
ncbi:hypothetical protein [Microbispora catharanthi]|uniref:Uncharacterized protein n=1 Tax=Microbispora catharanthi TaxID=1712871 RepID=A0A5N6BUC5_9ACTN|nr:hypothetical protein [Microbispora catharanthi]KAB8184041.1 hypothetical protein FH610_017015 [Microbispora catharanthi]